MENNLFLICTTERTGSYLLMDLLQHAGIEQIFVDLLSGVGNIGSSSDEDWLSYWNGIPDRCGFDLRRLYGGKLYGAGTYIATRYLKITNTTPSTIKWIWLRRKNKLLQAISLYRSQVSGKWHFGKDWDDPENTIPEMVVPPEEVYPLILRLALSELAWDNFFRDNGIEPYVLFYEDFEDESTWRDVILSVLEYLEGFRRSHVYIETTHAKSPRVNLDEIYEKLRIDLAEYLPEHPMYKPWLKI